MKAHGLLITGFLWMALAAVIGMKLPRWFNINPWWSVLLVPLMLILAICAVVIVEQPDSPWRGLGMILVNVAVLGGWLYSCARILLINTGRVIAKRVGALLLLWLPLTVIGGNMFLNESGVCISQMRRFTDDELIEMAVRSLARGGGSTIENTEQSVQKFLRDNPRCCEVSWTDNTPFQIFLGWVTKEVRVHYEQNRLGLSDRYNGESFVMDTCGNTLDRINGFSENTPTTTNHVYQPKEVKQ